MTPPPSNLASSEPTIPPGDPLPAKPQTRASDLDASEAGLQTTAVSPDHALNLLSVADLASEAGENQIVRLDEAVRRLETEDPDVAQVVRLRFYAGLSGEETALTLGRSPATVDRDWAWARAWLFRQLRSASP